MLAWLVQRPQGHAGIRLVRMRLHRSQALLGEGGLRRAFLAQGWPEERYMQAKEELD